jgi:HEAT repeat protein
MTERVLVIAAVAEAAVLLGCGLTLVVHVAWSKTRSRRHAVAVHQARQAAQQVALDETASTSGVDALGALPLDLALAVLHGFGRSLSGQAKSRLHQLAVDAGISDHAERWSRSRHWWRRVRALRLLTHLQPESASLEPFLDDLHPAVRAAAAQALVAVDPSPRALSCLVTMLEDPDPMCRFAARAALMGCGSSAARALRTSLSRADCPRPAVVLDIALDVADASFLDVAVHWSLVADPPTREASAALLARVAGEAAAGWLLQLLGDHDAGVRAASAKGLGELGHWPAAAALGTALGDADWEVRAAAALALRRIGAPGRVYLRAALRSTDAFAADIARQSLALPDSVLSGAVP